MKKFVFALALAACATASAQSRGLRQFPVKTADFSPAHVTNPTTAHLTVDYDASTVTLVVDRAMPPCPAGQMCAQMMPQPLTVELPITSIEKDDCGILTVTAQKDLRPVDGGLGRITLEDITEMTCQTYVAVEAHAKYETNYIDRQSGHDVDNVSTMILSNVRLHVTSTRSLEMVSGKFVKGFPVWEIPDAGTLLISDKSILLEISRRVECKTTACPRYMPFPIRANLPIVKTEAKNCGVLITARADHRLTDGDLQEVQIMDYRNSTCLFIARPSTHVQYRSFFQGLNGHKVNEEAQFEFSSVTRL